MLANACCKQFHTSTSFIFSWPGFVLTVCLHGQAPDSCGQKHLDKHGSTWWAVVVPGHASLTKAVATWSQERRTPTTGRDRAREQKPLLRNRLRIHIKIPWSGPNSYCHCILLHVARNESLHDMLAAWQLNKQNANIQ